MRLYLSSYRLGRRAELLRHAGPGTGRARIVLNALDVYGEGRLHSYDRETDDLVGLGYEPAELDLRAGPVELAGVDLLWVVGGNAFVLAAAAERAGLRDALRSSWAAGSGLIYAGYSAGACVAGPDLTGITAMDDPSEADYDGLPPGLGLIPERIVPHWRSDHREAPAAEEAVAALVERGDAHLPLRDGDDHVVGL